VLKSRDHRLVDLARSHILASATAPRFVWVHLLGPHEYARAPAVPPSGWAPGVEDLDVLREAYASNVAVAREQIRTLTEAAEGWVVAVTSDHGEAFGEGGHRGHGRALQDAELQVPLVLRGPGLSGGVVVEQVALAEVGPWLLEPREGGLTPRAAVPVGGVRRDATAFALREPGGVYDAQQPPGDGGALLEMDLETRAALEAMGYTDPE